MIEIYKPEFGESSMAHSEFGFLFNGRHISLKSRAAETRSKDVMPQESQGD